MNNFCGFVITLKIFELLSLSIDACCVSVVATTHGDRSLVHHLLFPYAATHHIASVSTTILFRYNRLHLCVNLSSSHWVSSLHLMSILCPVIYVKLAHPPSIHNNPWHIFSHHTLLSFVCFRSPMKQLGGGRGSNFYTSNISPVMNSSDKIICQDNFIVLILLLKGQFVDCRESSKICFCHV